MPLSTGTRLGSYEVSAQIGAGGMGEVYKARDTKLGRDVAIKILPEALAHDAERLARFHREAKMLAALNHPNIATIHGLEQSNGTHFLIIELVAIFISFRGPQALKDIPEKLGGGGMGVVNCWFGIYGTGLPDRNSGKATKALMK